MTLARLEAEMSVDEFELWMAEDLVRHDECPHCGIEPRDLMEYQRDEQKCPICKNTYHKTKRITPWPSLVQLAASEVFPAGTP